MTENTQTIAETCAVSIDHQDEINAAILSVSEDQIHGFHEEPFRVIAERCGLDEETVCLRIRAMLEGGTIRRVRQTLVATNLAEGALVAWKVDAGRLDETFEYLFHNDPFSGHVVVRSTDAETPGSEYRLWTTLKVPQGFDMDEHCRVLCERTGARAYRLMPAKGFFVLGVGHTRRKSLEPGARDSVPARIMYPSIVELSELDWQVLLALKRELDPHEIAPSPWRRRAAEAGVDMGTFLKVARSLDARKVIGRFSTFLEHVKPNATGKRVTRFNALFHWAVPQGREIEAGSEVGRHHILTHCYWREAGPEFGNVNIMAVAHGAEKQTVLEHKAAIDRHLAEAGIPVAYTNVFWGGRSEIKPSEISPVVYRDWFNSMKGRD